MGSSGDFSKIPRLAPPKRKLSSSQFALLERAVRYGEARTATPSERAMALGALTRMGLVTTEPVGERTLRVLPSEAGRAVVEDAKSARGRTERGSSIGFGVRRNYPKLHKGGG